jgi:hypothetical protein
VDAGAAFRRRAADRSARSVADRLQRGAIDDQEPVLVRADHAVLAPSTHDPYRRLDRRTNHVGELLSRQDQRDEDAVITALTHVGPQFQEEPGQPPFDPAARQLCQAIGQLYESMRQPHQQAANHQWVTLKEREERLARNEQAGGRFQCDGAGRVRPRLIDRYRADGISWPEQFEDHVRAPRRGLENLHPASDHRVHQVRSVALTEQRCALLEGTERRDRRQTLQVVRLQPSKQDAPAQAVVDLLGHMTRIIASRRRRRYSGWERSRTHA